MVTVCSLLHFHLSLKLLKLLGTNCTWRNINNGIYIYIYIYIYYKEIDITQKNDGKINIYIYIEREREREREREIIIVALRSFPFWNDLPNRIMEILLQIL